jgi:hypothetical protein
MKDIPRSISLIYIYISWYIERYTYIRIYHGIYHNIFSSFISYCILVPSTGPAAPPVPCSSRRRFNVLSALASFGQSLSTPLLSFFHSDPARQPPPIAPHPEVELIEPASVASPHAGICSSSSPVPKAVGQGGMQYWYVTHSGASASSLNKSTWPCSSTASCRSAFNR